MSKTILIVGCSLIVLAGAGLYAVSWLTAPKAPTNAELLAVAMEDWPEEIPEAQLAMMTEVRFFMPGFD